MVDLTKITLHDGIPVSGDGDVATINALMADGGLTTVGLKADAANPATDATPISLMSVMKQVSKTLQAIEDLLPTALGSGGGLKVDGSGTALPVEITGSGVVTLAQGYQSKVTFTCPTNAYAAGDVVGAAGGGVLSFTAMAPGAGELMIISATLELDRSAVISGETTYTLHLYNSTPPSAYADNAAWDLGSSDRTAYVGSIALGTINDLGSTLWCQVNDIQKQIHTNSSTLYGYLVTAGAYTPTATSISVTLDAQVV